MEKKLSKEEERKALKAELLKEIGEDIKKEIRAEIKAEAPKGNGINDFSVGLESGFARMGKDKLEARNKDGVLQSTAYQKVVDVTIDQMPIWIKNGFVRLA